MRPGDAARPRGGIAVPGAPMPSSAVSRSIPAVALALTLAPLPLAAQHVVGADVNAIGEAEGASARQPLFFPSATLAPKGRIGVSLQAVGARERVRYDGSAETSRIDTDALITTGSVSWVATSW